jgi:2-polyprenyl-6-methoxyphenol hydroxylase-like FAD-dependent oxidoreductase
MVVCGFWATRPIQWSPFQGQGANMAMLDALKLARLLSAACVLPTASAALEADIVTRGRKAVLESRSAAAQFHAQSRFKQMNRIVGFRVANVFIKLFSRSAKRSPTATA